MFCVIMPDGRYVIKEGGWVIFTYDKGLATKYRTKEAAEGGKVGHHKDMGGSGFKGRVVNA